MKILKSQIAFLLPFGIAGAILAADSANETPEALRQRLQNLQQENNKLETDNLKAQIMQEEEKNAALKQGGSTPSQPQVEKTEPAPSQPPEKSKWVKERNRVEDQVEAGAQKVGKEAERVGKQVEGFFKKL